MLKRLKQFSALGWPQKKVFLQAYCLLGVMRLGVLTLSFKRMSRTLRQHKTPPAYIPLGEGQLASAGLIARAVWTASRYTPWSSNCLAQALTAQRMLAKRHIPGMIYLGVKKEQQQLEAHAWLQCDAYILTGKAGHEAFTVVSTFSWCD